MAFNFFRKNQTQDVPKKEVDLGEGISEEALMKVDGGYSKTQDELNEILSDAYSNADKKDELRQMLEEKDAAVQKKL